jgi:hypothetical protein
VIPLRFTAKDFGVFAKYTANVLSRIRKIAVDFVGMISFALPSLRVDAVVGFAGKFHQIKSPS